LALTRNRHARLVDMNCGIDVAVIPASWARPLPLVQPQYFELPALGRFSRRRLPFCRAVRPLKTREYR
jgi:hypothetical protein